MVDQPLTWMRTASSKIAHFIAVVTVLELFCVDLFVEREADFVGKSIYCLRNPLLQVLLLSLHFYSSLAHVFLVNKSPDQPRDNVDGRQPHKSTPCTWPRRCHKALLEGTSPSSPSTALTISKPENDAGYCSFVVAALRMNESCMTEDPDSTGLCFGSESFMTLH